MSNKNKNWFEEGWQHIWHPYAQMQTTPLPYKVKGTESSRIILEDGSELIDGISSWWSACHGYNHPHLMQAMKQQIDEFSHVMFAGFAHEPAYKLAKRLSYLSKLDRVFFADSGSVAVEVAMKMATQYWRNKGEKRKNKFICFRDGYHGDTMGALSLGDPNGWIAKAFNNYMPEQICVDLPRDEYAFTEFEEIVEGLNNEVAGLIIEPLVQGAGGMKFHSADILAEIHRICKKHNIIFIADEIMTGFYRTGNLFACNEAGIKPDIMCVGKALTGGMVSLAATITNTEIYDEFLGESLDKAFLHGPTFMANPLACAAANASLDLFEEDDYLQKVENIENYFHENLRKLENKESVKQVRIKGAIGVVQLKPMESEDNMWEFMFDIRKKFVNHGVFLRPFKDIIYIMPNYNISELELGNIIEAIDLEIN